MSPHRVGVQGCSLCRDPVDGPVETPFVVTIIESPWSDSGVAFLLLGSTWEPVSLLTTEVPCLGEPGVCALSWAQEVREPRHKRKVRKMYNKEKDQYNKT